jgi:hypothetical protein
MKTLWNTTLSKVFAALILSFTLASFTSLPGGESYTIDVDNKRVIEQFVTRTATMPTLALGRNSSEMISIYYNHCGSVGNNRSLVLKNSEDKILKEWHFTNTSGDQMVIKAADIIRSFSASNTRLHLTYTSKELPSGRELVSFTIGNTTAALK